jgi:hypothetical protein
MVKVKMNSCIDCGWHDILPDPDPDDWFCDDDVKVICKKTGQVIIFGCRPHHVRSECKIPMDCPIRVK